MPRPSRSLAHREVHRRDADRVRPPSGRDLRGDRRSRALRGLLERLERREVSVAKRTGEPAEFNVHEIERAITHCCADIGAAIDIVGIIRDTKLSLYDGITTSEINQAVIMAMRARIERDPAYSALAARFLINDLPQCSH